MSNHYHPDPEQVALAHALGESLAAILPLSRLHEQGTESPKWDSPRKVDRWDYAASLLRVEVISYSIGLQ